MLTEISKKRSGAEILGDEKRIAEEDRDCINNDARI